MDLEEKDMLEVEVSEEEIVDNESEIIEEEVLEVTTEFAEEEEKCPKCGKPIDECTCEEKGCYSLEEIPEYTELLSKYSELESQHQALLEEVKGLKEVNEELTSFKLAAERKDKEAMINSFYMLSDEDKKDVLDNIDQYSIDDIEAKLSIICVRNKVSFDLDDDKKETSNGPTTYNLMSAQVEDELVPAWVKAARAVANETK